MSLPLLSGTLDINSLMAFIFGVAFLLIMLGFAVGFPNPTSFQIQVFMTVLSTAAAGVGAVLPGYIEFKYKNMLRAGGAFALFAIVWFSQPFIARSVANLQVPLQPITDVINNFLSNLDKGDINATYNELDPNTKENLNVELWRQLYNANVKPLGAVERRVLMGVNSLTSPPGFPIGIYRQQGFLTKYANVNGCRQEAVIVRATQDNKWQVYSYLIAPNTIECPLS
ncbi:DUF4019 domain-containing protein [Dankookia sp. GCM10030260]|uniref:DUF4019 domain-containing protein n=1 Tax=Dankookia sp. GCM10030260 TaxID=3273390 RepID=UPI00361128A4